eukprot:397694-Pelagomonas_calceolata.AAC.1
MLQSCADFGVGGTGKGGMVVKGQGAYQGVLQTSDRASVAVYCMLCIDSGRCKKRPSGTWQLALFIFAFSLHHIGQTF